MAGVRHRRRLRGTSLAVAILVGVRCGGVCLHACAYLVTYFVMPMADGAPSGSHSGLTVVWAWWQGGACGVGVVGLLRQDPVF